MRANVFGGICASSERRRQWSRPGRKGSALPMAVPSVSRNLWHSCVQVTLEELFARSEPSVLELARTYVSMLHSLGDVQVIPQRTRLVCVARVRFAGLSPRKDGFLASFSLHRWLDSPRIVKTADYGPRWRSHYVLVQSQADLNDELMTWLQEAHDVVGMQSGLRTE
jgi:hypothetical protein